MIIALVLIVIISPPCLFVDPDGVVGVAGMDGASFEAVPMSAHGRQAVLPIGLGAATIMNP